MNDNIDNSNILNNNEEYTAHMVSLKGKRSDNEDKHCIILNLEEQNPELAKINFFSVYDGHGGKFVSKFLEKNLHLCFTNKNISYPINKDYIYLIFKHIQDTLREKYNQQALHTGSTCLIVIHFKIENEEYLDVINTGDCRCVISRNNNAIPLTKDHKPDWPEERRRIEKTGGKIYVDNHGDYRIKDLSVSRAFGDLDAEPHVTNIPDIFRYKIEKTDSFIIIACDGLWDVLSNSEAVNFVLNNCYDQTLKNRISKNVNIAKKLAEYALTMGSGDNLTVIVVFFK